METKKKISIIVCMMVAFTMCFQGMVFAAEETNISDSQNSAANKTEEQSSIVNDAMDAKDGMEEPLSFKDCDWQDEIDEMLDASDHAKGEVVAGVKPGALAEAATEVETASKSAAEVETASKSAAEVESASKSAAQLKEKEEKGTEGSKESTQNKKAALKSARLIASGKKLMETTATDEDMELISIKSNSMSTEQILKTLKEDERVIFAEPNYVTENEQLTQNKSAAQKKIASNNESVKNNGYMTNNESVKNNVYMANNESVTGNKSFIEYNTKETKSIHSNNSKLSAKIGGAKPFDAVIDDATPLQWGNFQGAEMKMSAQKDPSVHVPGFGSTGSNMKNEAIVAVIDMPIDFDHPDLKKTAYTFTAKQQKKLKCNKYGYNAASKDGKFKFFDECDHGMHCAGIIGASWDGKGISGVASKAKIISIQNLDKSGKTSLVNDLRAFDFVKRAKQSGIDIRVTSNSWGIVQSSKAVNAAVYELGKKYGIVSCFAAGNDRKEIMNMNDIGFTLRNNPYAIKVAATNMNDEITYFSSYGVADVTLGAPGSMILSSISQDSSKFIPDMTKTTNKFYEGFEGEPKVTIRQVDEAGNYVSGPAVKTVQGEAAFSGKTAMKIDVDPKYYKQLNNGTYMCRLELDLGDLSEKGITRGDYFGVSLAGKMATMCDNCNFSSADGSKKESMQDLGGYASLWFAPNCSIPNGIDTKNMKATLEVETGMAEKNTIYIDSIGIGDQKVPYAFFDGTSMATPQVAGAAVVLAGNDSKLRGAALAKKVASMTRPNKSLKGKTKTGGVLDFQAKSGASSKTQTGPLITSMKVKGKVVTIKGSRFGKKKGSVKVYKFVTGKKDSKKSAKITKWSSSQVKVKLGKKFKGIMKVVLTSKTGSSFVEHKFISKSKNIYSKDLKLSQKTGKPLKIDAQGDYETNGPLQAIKGKLYYLPHLTKIEQTPACKKFMMYDIKKKKWKRLPDLPQWLENVSVAAYKGKLIVKGTRMGKEFDGSPIHIEELKNSNSRIYIFDPKKYSKLSKSKKKKTRKMAKKKAWKKASNKNVKITATILNRKGKLLLAGGCDYTKSPQPGQKYAEYTCDLVKYSLKKGAGKRILKFGSLVSNPSVAVKGNKICVYNYERYEVFMVNGSKVKKLKNALPKYVMTGRDNGAAASVSEREGVVVTAPKGFMLVGPAATNGSSDTFLLKNGSKKFKAFKRRASDARVIAPAAAACKGRIYVIGSSALEKGYRFFRSTKM